MSVQDHSVTAVPGVHNIGTGSYMAKYPRELQGAPAGLSQDDCYVHLISQDKTGNKLLFCLKKDGTQLRRERIQQNGRYETTMKETKIEISNFFDQWGPMIDAILQDTKDGPLNVDILVPSPPVSAEMWFVRNRAGTKIGAVCFRGPVERGIEVKSAQFVTNVDIAQCQSVLPEHYVDLWEMMIPDPTGIVSWAPKPSDNTMRCSVS
jgi:hypothetical protein